MVFGTESKLVKCPLCEGSREVDDKDADFLMKHPWKAAELMKEAQRRASEPSED